MIAIIKKVILGILKCFMSKWNYFLFESKHGRKEVLKKYHYSVEDSILIKEKAPIYIFMANGLSWHGGLCDRFKGIVTCYKWCKTHHHSFKICFNTPFLLEEYLTPNVCDWRINEANIIYNKHYSDVFYMMCDKSINELIKNGSFFRLVEQHLDRQLSHTNKKQIHCYTNAQPESNEEFGCLFKELFKPSEKLKIELNHHLEEIGCPYISISFRFLQLLNDFKDTYGEKLSKEEGLLLIKKSVTAIEEVHKLNPQYEKILVTSDSSRFLSYALSLPYVYVVDGDVGHIEFEPSNDANLKTFLDFFLIAQADKVYLGLSDKMYKSDFAYRASMLNGREFEIITY